MWEDCETYYLSTIPQGTKRWHGLRKGLLTMSNLSQALDHSMFGTPRELAEQMAGLRKKEFSENSSRLMKIGNEREPIARKWYKTTTGYKVCDVGLACPKWMPCIGGSTDGDVLDGVVKRYHSVEVGDGCIEIKCPEKFYRRLDEYEKGKDDIQKFMYSSHYDQIQGNLFISNKKWCDYIVYCQDENKVFMERVYPNVDYWNEVCVPGINKFFDDNKDIIQHKNGPFH